MSVASVELQKAIFAVLRDDPEIATVVGNRIHDTLPARVVFPYLTLGRTTAYDWSTGTEIGTEHLFTIHVWSKAKGKTETLDLMGRIETLLRDGPLLPEGHHLVNLTPDFAESRFDEELSLHHGLMRYRAVTEPVA